MKTPRIAPFALAAVATAVACSSKDDSDGAPNLTVTISGEGAALTGFSFPPASADDLAFVDGWDIRFDRILVTVDEITLSNDPDLSPTDQARTGAVVAVAKGPWAVDMTKPAAITGIQPKLQVMRDEAHAIEVSGKDPHAQPLASFDALDGNRSFDPTLRYAFGFDVVTANAAAKTTNLDAAALEDYREMADKGLSVLYVGTATFKGTDCKSSAGADYKFEDHLPRSVKFRFGFHTPTRYENCQNTDLHGEPFGGEEAQRGVQVGSQGRTIAQITLHVDHPFWNTVDHDASELYFDQMAAAATPDGTLTIDDLSKLDFTHFKDAAGNALPWRSCIADKPVKQGTRRFDSGSVPVDPNALPDAALRNYSDYVAYQQSTQGHLNADGLCAIERRFASPR